MDLQLVFAVQMMVLLPWFKAIIFLMRKLALRTSDTIKVHLIQLLSIRSVITDVFCAKMDLTFVRCVHLMHLGIWENIVWQSVPVVILEIILQRCAREWEKIKHFNILCNAPKDNILIPGRTYAHLAPPIAWLVSNSINACPADLDGISIEKVNALIVQIRSTWHWTLMGNARKNVERELITVSSNVTMVI